MSFSLRSDAFAAGKKIPRKYTGDGQDLSPALTWADPPSGTREFALICDDPDAPTREPWVHWVIYAIAGDVRALPEGVPATPRPSTPSGAAQGRNSWTSGSVIGYRGPAPPPGHGVHHYHFRIYALDSPLDARPEATKTQILKAMSGHVLAEAELVGTYER
jgi:hypothetical protein